MVCNAVYLPTKHVAILYIYIYIYTRVGKKVLSCLVCILNIKFVIFYFIYYKVQIWKWGFRFIALC